MAAWHARPGATLKLNLNLSARQFAEPALPGAGEADHRRDRPRAGAVWLEITEATLFARTATQASRRMRRLHELGVRMVIDDFGTGASSLASLKHFPLDAIKIASTFVADLGRDRDSDAICSAIVELAHSLGLCAIAEGVETLEQFAALPRRSTASSAQGHLFGPARPAEDYGAAPAAMLGVVGSSDGTPPADPALILSNAVRHPGAMRPVRTRAPATLVAVTRWIPVLVALTLAAGLTRGDCLRGHVPARPRPGPRRPGSSLTWKGCGGGFQCATLTVPLDPSNPEAAVDEPTLDLAVIRARARDAEQPHRRAGAQPRRSRCARGAVPAQRGVVACPSEVRDRFDLVAFDPRGVGESEPIECADSLDPVVRRRRSNPPTAAARSAALVAAVTSLAQQCTGAQRLISWRTCRPPTRSRDLEQLRVALGDRRLSYVGVLLRHLPRCELRPGTSRSGANVRARRAGRPVAVGTARSPSGRLAASSTRSTTSWPTAPTIAAARSTTVATPRRPTTRCAPRRPARRSPPTIPTAAR